MNIAILTTATPDRSDIFSLTSPTKQAYATRYGMKYIFSDTFKNELKWTGHIYWLKPHFIKKHIQDHDAIIWLDDDAGFCRYDIDIRPMLLSIDHPMAIAKDECGPNAGMLFIKNCPEAITFIDWWTKESKEARFQRDNYDNNALNWYIEKENPDVCTFIDGHVFNAHHPSFTSTTHTKDIRNSYDPEKTVIVHIAGGAGRKNALKHTGELEQIYKAPLDKLKLPRQYISNKGELT